MIVDNLGYSEVRDLDAVLVDEDVLGLDVAVDDVAFLQKAQGNDHLSDETLYHFLAEPLGVFEQKVLEGALVAVLDEQEEGVGTLLGVDVLEDVGMGDFAQ